MGHNDSVKWWNTLNKAQKNHIQKTHGNMKTAVTGFSNSEKSNLMKQYQHDLTFCNLNTGDKYKQQSPTPTDWTEFTK